MNTYPLTGFGTIIYDPKRPGLKKKTEHWCIISVNKDYTRYYRWWVKNRYGIKLDAPAWDAHISIIRGEDFVLNKPELWKKYDKQKVEFHYNNLIYLAKDCRFWGIGVQCDLGTLIRDEFDLNSHWDFHLTIGTTRSEHLII